MLFVCATCLGAFLSRWHGGGFFKAPKWVKNVAFALPLGLLLFYLLNQEVITLGYGKFADVFAAIFATAAILGAKAMGHGGGFDLGHSKEEPGEGRDLERIERWFFLYPYAYNVLPRYWYDALILYIKGALISLAPALLLGFKSTSAALLAFAGGALGFPAGYMLGWLLFENTLLLSRVGMVPTEVGEFVSGGLLFGAFVLAVFMVI